MKSLSKLIRDELENGPMKTLEERLVQGLAAHLSENFKALVKVTNEHRDIDNILKCHNDILFGALDDL